MALVCSRTKMLYRSQYWELQHDTNIGVHRMSVLDAMVVGGVELSGYWRIQFFTFVCVGRRVIMVDLRFFRKVRLLANTLS